MADTSIADVDALLLDVSSEEPCGPNLEYDPEFLSLEQEVAGKPEVQYCCTITPAVPPDWKTVKTLSLKLLARSRDLRIVVPLARALLKTQGVAGFAVGLKLLERLLDARWDGVHPQLDPDDGNDPILRVNTLSSLCESATFLRDLREAYLVSSRAHGRFSLRDFDIATGELDVPETEEKPTLAIIDAAFMDIDLVELEQSYQSLAGAYDSSVRLEQVLTEKVGVGQALDLGALSKMLKRARDFVHERLSRRSAVAAPAEAAAADTVEGQPVQTNTPGAAPRSGEISSREDVVQMLEKICAYYAKHEPSSPIPLLLQRAQRLASKSFVEILQDLAPDGLNQIYQISGAQKDS